MPDGVAPNYDFAPNWESIEPLPSVSRELPCNECKIESEAKIEIPEKFHQGDCEKFDRYNESKVKT